MSLIVLSSSLGDLAGRKNTWIFGCPVCRLVNAILYPHITWSVKSKLRVDWSRSRTDRTIGHSIQSSYKSLRQSYMYRKPYWFVRELIWVGRSKLLENNDVFYAWIKEKSSRRYNECRRRSRRPLMKPLDAHKTQTYICMMKHSHSPYTSTYSSTPHNTNRKHNIHHIPYTNTQHISTLQG